MLLAWSSERTGWNSWEHRTCSDKQRVTPHTPFRTQLDCMYTWMGVIWSNSNGAKRSNSNSCTWDHGGNTVSFRYPLIRFASFHFVSLPCCVPTFSAAPGDRLSSNSCVRDGCVSIKWAAN